MIIAKKLSRRSSLDSKLVNTFTQASLEALNAFTGKESHLKTIHGVVTYCPSGDICALMPISNPRGEGAFGLSLPLTLANQVVAKLRGAKPNRISSEDRRLGMGDLINVISHKVTTILIESNIGDYAFTLPTVIEGTGPMIPQAFRNDIYLVMFYETDDLSFDLHIAFQEYDQP